MAEISVHRSFLSAGVNRVVNALDWADDDGLVAYGSHQSVVIYDPMAAHVRYNLLGHCGLVNCVKWIPKRGEELIRISYTSVTHSLWFLSGAWRCPVGGWLVGIRFCRSLGTHLVCRKGLM